MSRKLKILWLLVTFATVVAVPVGTVHWIQNGGNPELMTHPIDTATALLAKGNKDGALSVYDFIVENGMDDESGTAQASRTALIAEMTSTTQRAKDFFSGLIWGDIKNTASLIGCVAGDVTVWGDFRDFVKQSYRAATGEEVDKLIMGLSAIGLATTVAPHVDAGISVLKNMTKFLSAPLRRLLTGILANSKRLPELEALASTVGGIYKKIGGGVVDVLQMAKSSEELAKLSRFLEVYGKSAYSAIMVGGKGVVSFLDTATDLGVLKLGKKGLRFAVTHPQVAARMLKITKKVGWDHLPVTMVALAKLLAMLPLKWVAAACLAMWGWLSLGSLADLLLSQPRRVTTQTGNAVAA